MNYSKGVPWQSSAAPHSAQGGAQVTAATARRRPTRTSPLAIASLVISTLSFVLLPLNLLGVFFGLVSRRSIAKSAGTLGGEAIALAGIVVGSVSVVVSVIATAIIGANLLSAPATRDEHSLNPSSLPISTSLEPPTASAPAPTYTHADRLPVRGAKSRQQAVGHLLFSDVDPEVVSLADALDQERLLAQKAARQPVLLLSSPSCTACDVLQQALQNPDIADTVGKLWIIRLDVRQFETELEQLGIPARTSPALVRLNHNSVPVDYLDRREWDSGSQQNIAPLVNDFLCGKLRQRKHPWRGLPRDDETPI